MFDATDAAVLYLFPARRGNANCDREARPQATAAAIASALLLSLGLVTSGIAQEKLPAKVILSLDFIPLGRHAPWYAALAEGYFKEEGLDVSIIPSQGTAQTIQAVESGTANIAFVDVPSVVLARANFDVSTSTI